MFEYYYSGVWAILGNFSLDPYAAFAQCAHKKACAVWDVSEFAKLILICGFHD